MQGVKEHVALNARLLVAQCLCSSTSSNILCALYCRPTRGVLHLMGGIATLGLVFLTPFLKDTGHYCPKCGRKVAMAKLM